MQRLDTKGPVLVDTEGKPSTSHSLVRTPGLCAIRQARALYSWWRCCPDPPPNSSLETVMNRRGWAARKQGAFLFHVSSSSKQGKSVKLRTLLLTEVGGQGYLFNIKWTDRDQRVSPQKGTRASSLRQRPGSLLSDRDVSVSPQTGTRAISLRKIPGCLLWEGETRGSPFRKRPECLPLQKNQKIKSRWNTSPVSKKYIYFLILSMLHKWEISLDLRQ